MMQGRVLITRAAGRRYEVAVDVLDRVTRVRVRAEASWRTLWHCDEGLPLTVAAICAARAAQRFPAPIRPAPSLQESKP